MGREIHIYFCMMESGRGKMIKFQKPDLDQFQPNTRNYNKKKITFIKVCIYVHLLVINNGIFSKNVLCVFFFFFFFFLIVSVKKAALVYYQAVIQVIKTMYEKLSFGDERYVCTIIVHTYVAII